MNIFENIPYNSEKMGNRKLVDKEYLLLMQIALRPEQIVPLHNANSNVHLLVMRGAVTVTLAGTDHQLREEDLLPVAFQTPMTIRNSSAQDATFLVWKTPNPSEMRN